MSDFPFALTEENVVTWKNLTEAEKGVRRILATALGGPRTSDAAATSGRDLHTTALYDTHGVYGYALGLDGSRSSSRRCRSEGSKT